MGLLGVKYDAFGERFAPEEQTVRVAFGTAVGEVAPAILNGRAQRLAEEIQNFVFHLERVHAVVAHFGIAHVVDGEVEKWR